MVLVDTSVWIDHTRFPDNSLEKLLLEERVVTHPFVLGELAMGTLKRREETLDAIQGLPRALSAYDEEVVRFVSERGLFGTGIGYLDAHLLASVKLMDDAQLWTRDKRLLAAAERLGLSWNEPKPS